MFRAQDEKALGDGRGGETRLADWIHRQQFELRTRLDDKHNPLLAGQ